MNVSIQKQKQLLSKFRVLFAFIILFLILLGSFLFNVDLTSNDNQRLLFFIALIAVLITVGIQFMIGRLFNLELFKLREGFRGNWMDWWHESPKSYRTNLFVALLEVVLLIYLILANNRLWQAIVLVLPIHTFLIYSFYGKVIKKMFSRHFGTDGEERLFTDIRETTNLGFKFGLSSIVLIPLLNTAEFIIGIWLINGLNLDEFLHFLSFSFIIIFVLVQDLVIYLGILNNRTSG